MLKAKHATTTLPALIQELDKIDYQKIAIQTGLIKRITKGFCAQGYLLGLLKAVASGDGSLRKLASNLASSVGTASLSKQALHYRVNESAVNFLKKVSTHLLNSVITAEGQTFLRILIQDSSQLRLPKQNSEHYRGIGNQWGEKSSSKLDLVTDYLSGDIVDLEMSDGTKQDRISGKDILAHVEAKDLILRDMGYFSTAVFKEIESAGAFYISRLPSNTCVYLDNENHPKLESYLKAQSSSTQQIDITAELTAAKKHSVRVIAIRCNEETTNQRRAKAKEHRKKMGSQPNKLTLEREGWTIYITNLTEEHYSAEQIHKIYSIRWNIEIQFRALKSHAHIRELLNRVCKNKHHLNILMQALMIYAQLTAKSFTALKKAHPQWGIRLSIELVSSWLNKEIQGLKNLISSLVYYDLRHLSSDKRPSRISQSQLANYLF
jgi:hypothetical protein